MSAELRVLDGDGDPYVIDGFDTRAHAPGLSKGALRSARVLAEGLFSTDEGPPPLARLDWMEQDLADFFGHTSRRAGWLFRACLVAVTVFAPLLIGRMPGLSRLSVEERVEALERMEQTPLSLALLAAKAILSLVYYEHPDASRAIGWDASCLGPPT
ncbi:MAG: hypothetical protein AB8I08_25505 [Sandaracinaceae bacterium]